MLPPATNRPCNECPWRRNAWAGWLGPLTATQWAKLALSDAPIACHKTIKEDYEWEGASQCRGAAIFRENIHKSPRDREIVVGPADPETVFDSPIAFLQYHDPDYPKEPPYPILI